MRGFLRSIICELLKFRRKQKYLLRTVLSLLFHDLVRPGAFRLSLFSLGIPWGVLFVTFRADTVTEICL